MQALVCDVEWVGTTCPGVLTSEDISGVVDMTAPFDWSLISTADLAELFAGGFGFVVAVMLVAYGAGLVLDVIRKS